jgi:hypothetical protein
VDLLQLDSEFHAHLQGKVSEVIVNGGWLLPSALRDFGDIQSRLNSLHLPTGHLPDVLVWAHASDGFLTSKMALSFLHPTSTLLPWAEHIWCPAVPPSHSFIFWRLHNGKMPTEENLRAQGCIVVSIFTLCLSADESLDHLFLRCPFALNLWNWTSGKLHCFIDCTSVDTLLSSRPVRCSSKVSDIFFGGNITHASYYLVG